MTATGRALLCLILLGSGFAAQAGLDALCTIERPRLRRPLTSLPTDLAGWIGHDEPVDPRILLVSDSTEFVSRTYRHPKFPGVVLSLWLNFSIEGKNMWHSPSICLPAHGNDLIESMSKVVAVPAPGPASVTISRLAYGPGGSDHAPDLDDSVQMVGFWYYIFGEGQIEQWVRGLPVTSRSSHGRTTRGSGLTAEVFWKNTTDPSSAAFHDFAQALLAGLEPILPAERAGYYIP